MISKLWGGAWEIIQFALIVLVVVLPVRMYVAQPFIVSGASMNPTFNNGQYLIVDELSYRLQSPSRGDVIIFRYPKNPKEFFIKRIIGLPTETVSINGNAITIIKADGSTLSLSEPYVTNHGNGSARSYQLKVDEYFVMGDNRPESSDSRVWGTLPRDNIVGRAFMRLLPLNSIGFFPGSLSTVDTGTPVQ